MTKEERAAIRREIRDSEVRSNARKDQLLAIVAGDPAVYETMIKQLSQIVDKSKDAEPNTIEFLESFCASSFRVEVVRAYYSRLLDLEEESEREKDTL